MNLLGSAADIICELSRGEKEFYKNLHIHYNVYFGNTPDDERPTIEVKTSLAKWLSVRLRTKWFWVRVQLQS